jgi:hypothetical protein
MAMDLRGHCRIASRGERLRRTEAPAAAVDEAYEDARYG